MPAIVLLRHGAHADVGLRLTGRGAERGLTDLGREQALAAATALRKHPPSAIYSSPQRRTQETARIVAEELGLAVMLAPELDEIDFGDWTGRSFDELDKDPRWQDWNANRASAICPSGETMGRAQARALAFAFEVAARHSAPPLLVTHCDIIRALVCWADRTSLNQIHDVTCAPGSLTFLDLVPEPAVAA